MNYNEVRTMPVAYRQWFINRLVREIDEFNSESSKSSPAENVSENLRNLDNFEKSLGVKK